MDFPYSCFTIKSHTVSISPVLVDVSYCLVGRNRINMHVPVSSFCCLLFG
jgi:hypothetical protein